MAAGAPDTSCSEARPPRTINAVELAMEKVLLIGMVGRLLRISLVQKVVIVQPGH